MAPHEELNCIADWAAKLHGAVVRIAGILHITNSVNIINCISPSIDEEILKRAVKLGKYLIAHALAAFTEMGSNNEINEAKYVLRWIEKTAKAKFSKREAHYAMQGKFKTAESLEPALNILVDYNDIRKLPADGRRGAGRKPSPVYEVNPLLTKLTQLTQSNGGCEVARKVFKGNKDPSLDNSLLEGEI